ncbi:conserved exported hypothetical protein [Bradyrhizobium sp. STM 3843]|uniref:DUF2950 domain-containing protein n=1 Tax=Bradyrhizobium sp. STM 3843 TaxID=551947 RepID=UPI000240405D|nr:DUF2950 domain-containing protein [Bradyrhizobium sp. STM 3843]CCE10364.1 conserved exported hypothetical protein [Bradyrhizobium sp. STM 3843]
MTPLAQKLTDCRRTTALAVTAAALLGISAVSAQETYRTPEKAVAALVTAVKSGEPREMIEVLGSDSAEIVESGDRIEDAETRQKFLSAYDAKHAISFAGDKKATLMIGPDDFPFPIPLVRRRFGWEFDTGAGRIEILYRRIGQNELDAIETCLAYVDAQNEYADEDRTGAGRGVYAQRFFSNPGKHDGLYWPPNGEASPLGELYAKASAEGYKEGSEPQPYHGYYYQILTRQGPNAPGGELRYVVGGKMIGGFALVAYPAEYGNSGVMTFLVNHAGTIYQKDLGERTTTIARRMISFDPDQTWKKVEKPKS